VELREDQAWLLRSRVNLFPISGVLSLEDERLSFVLDSEAGEASLGWLEEELGIDGMKQRLVAGERIVAFDHPLSECVITWPITGGGALMLVRAPERKWVVSYDYPAAGRIQTPLGMISGRRRAREWKKVLAESGA
jgi:hypothetical protein